VLHSFSLKTRVALVRSLEYIAPAAAGRIVADLFTTPRRIEAPEWERTLALQGRPRRIAGLSLVEFGAKVGPPIILLHGWEGRGMQLGQFVAPLRGLGARVITVDGPAHGESLGVTSGPFDFAKGLLDLQATLGPFRGIIAHSMGGPSTAIALSRGLQVERVAVLGAPADLNEVLGRFCDALGVGPRIRQAFRAEMSRRTGVSVEESRLVDFARDIEVPILVVHDRGDAEVPISDGHLFAAAFPRSQVVEVEAGGHRKMLKAPEVIAMVATFFGSRAAREYGRSRIENDARGTITKSSASEPTS
jgi:pimeloyl-ACP methyl ester carboxylesterase